MNVLIVGCGLYGAVCAHELNKAGHQCHIIEKRDHIAGNIYTKFNEQAQCHEHVYGAHIFHTNSQSIWDYVRQFAEFNHFTNRVKVNHQENIYSFPINLMTIYQVYGVKTPQEAREAIENDIVPCSNPVNMEEFCLTQIGRTLYELFIEGYTQKQWGRHPSELPSDIIKRIPFRLNFDDNYFNDRFQGIPIGGYTAIVEKMIKNSGLDLKTDFLNDKSYWLSRYDLIIYTGEIDRFFDYELGVLQYRSLKFESKIHDCNDWQGNAVINYTHADIPWTRSIEHKHFELGNRSSHTLVTHEFPDSWSPGKTPFYPINNKINNEIHESYIEHAKALPHVHFGGRLGAFRYYDMHQIIGAALHDCSKLLAA